MASVIRRKGKNGKCEAVWRYRYKHYTGKWKWGTGWPDKKRTLDYALTLEAEHRAIHDGLKPPPSARPLGLTMPIKDAIKEYLGWGKPASRTFCKSCLVTPK